MRTLATTIVLLAATLPAHANKRDNPALLSAIQAKNALAIEGAARKLPLPISQIWFDDAGCRKEFGGDVASVAKDRLPAFLACLDGLGLSADANGDGFVYEPGVALKPVWTRGQLMAIVGDDGKAGVPTVTNEALAANLMKGSLDVPLDKTTKKVTEVDPTASPNARLLVCIDIAGKVTSAKASTSSFPLYARTIEKAAKKWRFKPFTRAGKPLAVCAHRQYGDPLDPDGEEGGVEGGVVGGDYGGVMGAPPPPPPPPPPGAQNVSPTLLEVSRIAGEKAIVPDDKTRKAIQDSSATRLIASFKLCVDDTGKVTKVTMLKSSGFEAYDQKILREMRTNWAYRPYQVNGKAVPVCTAVTFIYSQK